MNTVKNLQTRSFYRLSLEEKLEVKRLGPDRPDLSILNTTRSTTGCSDPGKVYCFPCLLFGGALREKAWTDTGVNDWKHLSEKVKRHFGHSNIAEQLSSLSSRTLMVCPPNCESYEPPLDPMHASLWISCSISLHPNSFNKGVKHQNN